MAIKGEWQKYVQIKKCKIISFCGKVLYDGGFGGQLFVSLRVEDVYQEIKIFVNLKLNEM